MKKMISISLLATSLLAVSQLAAAANNPLVSVCPSLETIQTMPFTNSSHYSGLDQFAVETRWQSSSTQYTFRAEGIKSDNLLNAVLKAKEIMAASATQQPLAVTIIPDQDIGFRCTYTLVDPSSPKDENLVAYVEISGAAIDNLK